MTLTIDEALKEKARRYREHRRELIKEAMDLGVFACILAPYEEWEVMTIIRKTLARRQPIRLNQQTGEKPMNRARAF